jgi:hypothetical protein
MWKRAGDDYPLNKQTQSRTLPRDSLCPFGPASPGEVFMLSLKASRRYATENTYPPRILKNFHNKSCENKQKISKIPTT